MIQLEIEQEVAVVQMSRGKVNAMDLEFCRQLVQRLEAVAQDSTVAAVLIGNPRVFSAGVDLREIVNRDSGYLAEYLPALIEMFKVAFAFPKPIVAAISGHAIAGGCVLATACDRRLIVPEARIGLPELRIGVPLPSAAIEIMRFAVAPEALRGMVNVGRTFVQDQAVKVGLADEVVSPDQLRRQAIETARALTVVPANVFALSKAQQRAPALRNIAANEAEFGDRVREIWMSPENRKIVEAYVNERL